VKTFFKKVTEGRSYK